MATPAWATDLTNFWLEGATTVTSIGTGGAGLGNPETDFFIQGSNCLSKGAWTNAIKGFIVDALGTTFTVPTDGCVILFAKYDAAGSLASKANGGLRVIIGSGSGDYYHYYVGGNLTLAFDSWIPYAIDPNTATVDNTTGTPSGSERWVGILANLPTTSGPTKGNPIAIDAIRYGRGRIDYTDGDGTFGYNTFSGCESYGNDATRRWGLIELIRGAYLIQGFHRFGITSGTAVDFRDANKVLFWRALENNLTNDAVSAGFNRIEIQGASSNVDWDNIIFQALGTRARGRLVHTAGTFDAINCQFVDMDTFSLLSTSVMTNCIFRRTNAVTAPGSTLNGSQILTPTVGTDTSGLVWNVATDPDGKLDDMTFTKGTNAHHAIEFGTSTPTPITLRGISFSGFNAADGQNDSALRFLHTSGTLTVNLVGCSGTIKVKKEAGATVNLVVNPRTHTVNNLTTGSRVIWIRQSDDAELENKAESSGVATYSYTYGGDVDVWVQILSLSEKNKLVPVTLKDADATLNAAQETDPFYSNP